MVEFDFKNKKIFVMDGDSTLGKEIITSFIELQATVISMAQNNYKHEYTLYSETLKNKVELGTLDFNNPLVVEDLAAILQTQTKVVDVFINNSRKTNHKGILELSSNEWNEELLINLDIPFLLLKAVIPFIKENKEGSIINLSSISTINGGNGEVGFASVKSATESMNKALSRELSASNIRVNGISFAHNGLEKVEKKENSAIQGLNRTVNCSDVVNTILFLSSSLSTFVNGQVMLVDGGSTYR